MTDRATAAIPSGTIAVIEARTFITPPHVRCRAMNIHPNGASPISTNQPTKLQQFQFKLVTNYFNFIAIKFVIDIYVVNQIQDIKMKPYSYDLRIR
ncbi:MAG: hypothetical protein WC856_28000, partial [Methylococcaceae bacterium]